MTKEPQTKSLVRLGLKFLVPCLILLLVIINSLIKDGPQQFSYLAQAFLHGHPYFIHRIGGLGYDPVLYKGHVYWTDGPLPAILLMPFVALFSLFHLFFYQKFLQVFLVFGVGFFVYKLARIFKYSVEDSITLTFAFLIGSVFIGVSAVASSWLFAQVLTVFLLFWSLYEYFSRRRCWLIGVICGLLMLTRITAAPIIIFYGLELIAQKPKLSKHHMSYIKMFSPVVIAALLIGLYNFIRFHNPFNSGVAYQNSAISRSYGIFSLTHIPANAYSLLLRAPIAELKTSNSWILKFPYIENNPFGMSIFITSPYLIYLFVGKWKTISSTIKNLILAMAISLLAVLTYYGIGLQQFGDRYSLDFLPEVFVIFMILYKQNNKLISRRMNWLIFGTGLLNLYLLIPYAFGTN
jgi:hypothetical protein